MWLQGGDAGPSPNMYIYAVSDDVTLTQKTGVSGWVNWSNPSIQTIKVVNGTVTIGAVIQCDGGGWGTVDDFYLYKTAEIEVAPPTEPIDTPTPSIPPTPYTPPTPFIPPTPSIAPTPGKEYIAGDKNQASAVVSITQANVRAQAFIDVDHEELFDLAKANIVF